MTINIGDVSISIPVAISNWVKESEDNRTEFDGMIQSMMYAVNKVMKERNHVTPNPYQSLYEAQLELGRESGMTKEQVDSWISSYAKSLAEQAKTGNFDSDLENLVKLLYTLGKN